MPSDRTPEERIDALEQKYNKLLDLLLNDRAETHETLQGLGQQSAEYLELRDRLESVEYLLLSQRKWAFEIDGILEWLERMRKPGLIAIACVGAFFIYSGASQVSRDKIGEQLLNPQSLSGFISLLGVGALAIKKSEPKPEIQGESFSGIVDKL